MDKLDIAPFRISYVFLIEWQWQGVSTYMARNHDDILAATFAI